MPGQVAADRNEGDITAINKPQPWAELHAKIRRHALWMVQQKRQQAALHAQIRTLTRRFHLLAVQSRVDVWHEAPMQNQRFGPRYQPMVTEDGLSSKRNRARSHSHPLASSLGQSENGPSNEASFIEDSSAPPCPRCPVSLVRSGCGPLPSGVVETIVAHVRHSSGLMAALLDCAADSLILSSPSRIGGDLTQHSPRMIALLYGVLQSSWNALDEACIIRMWKKFISKRRRSQNNSSNMYTLHSKELMAWNAVWHRLEGPRFLEVAFADCVGNLVGCIDIRLQFDAKNVIADLDAERWPSPSIASLNGNGDEQVFVQRGNRIPEPMRRPGTISVDSIDLALQDEVENSLIRPKVLPHVDVGLRTRRIRQEMRHRADVACGIVKQLVKNMINSIDWLPQALRELIARTAFSVQSRGSVSDREEPFSEQAHCIVVHMLMTVAVEALRHPTAEIGVNLFLLTDSDMRNLDTITDLMQRSVKSDHFTGTVGCELNRFMKEMGGLWRELGSKVLTGFTVSSFVNGPDLLTRDSASKLLLSAPDAHIIRPSIALSGRDIFELYCGVQELVHDDSRSNEVPARLAKIIHDNQLPYNMTHAACDQNRILVVSVPTSLTSNDSKGTEWRDLDPKLKANLNGAMTLPGRSEDYENVGYHVYRCFSDLDPQFAGENTPFREYLLRCSATHLPSSSLLSTDTSSASLAIVRLERIQESLDRSSANFMHDDFSSTWKFMFSHHEKYSMKEKLASCDELEHLSARFQALEERCASLVTRVRRVHQRVHDVRIKKFIETAAVSFRMALPQDSAHARVHSMKKNAVLNMKSRRSNRFLRIRSRGTLDSQWLLSSMDLHSCFTEIRSTSIEQFIEQYCHNFEDIGNHQRLPAMLISALVHKIKACIEAAEELHHWPIELTLQQIRRYLLTRLFPVMFSTSDTRIMDLALQQKISRYQWVTLSSLDLPPRASLVSTLFAAIDEIKRINLVLDPALKVECVVRCVHLIFGALRVAIADELSALPGADLLMPALVYVLLRANPPQLHSNVQYCLDFWLPSMDTSSESGWFQFCLTTFASAVSFLSQLNRSSLNLSACSPPDEVSPESQPEKSKSQEISSAMSFGALKSVALLSI